MQTPYLQNIRRWAELNSDRKDARRLLMLLDAIEAEQDANKTRDLGRALAEISADVAELHGMQPWEFFGTRH